MPVYEYKCEKCGKHFDVLQKFSDEALTTHEDCGGALEKLVSPPAFHFKGTGWYVTDYAKTNGNSSPDKHSGSESKESKAETKSETKTETKSPAPASSPSSSESK